MKIKIFFNNISADNTPVAVPAELCQSHHLWFYVK